MKRFLALLLVILCLLSGCLTQNDESVPTTLPKGTTAAQPEETTLSTVEPQPTETTQPTEQASSYTVDIPLADQSIFDSPSYDGRFVGVVEEAGVYTIVEEATDDEGNLWGKLKSGAGWVDLTQIRETLQHPQPLSANFADDKLLKSGQFHAFQMDSDQSVIRVAFRATRKLADFSIHSVEFGDDGYQPDAVLYSLAQLDREKPLVADLTFPGDLSAYAISFTDESGTQYRYLLSVSGRNGTLVLHPF